MNEVKSYFEELAKGNASVINEASTRMLNNIAMSLYSKQTLNDEEVETLKYLVMSCNILYNRTDMKVLPVEDGVYDLLLEKYKTYNQNFQVGSAIVDFKNFVENDPNSNCHIAESPVIFLEPYKAKNEIHQYMHDKIMRKGEQILDRYDFSTCPIYFDTNGKNISKRTHNTEHKHPTLVGTLDKSKFVLNNDAIEAGAFNDANVKILERDFFKPCLDSGIIHENEEIEMVLELKYDGISVEADCGLEVESARTRGDTGIGAASDITPILKGYTFKHAGCMIGEKTVGVKFEAIITKSNLYYFNVARNKSYKNCRTAIVGLFGAGDAYLYRDLITLVPLAIDRDDVPCIKNRMEEIEFINDVFRSDGEPLRYCYIKGTVQECLYYIKAFADEAKIARDYLDFMYDGIVVSFLDEKIREKLGRKNFINKYSMAVKFDPLEKQTIFRGYTYEIGQHGNITPMIHYDPVEFIGTIHTKSTGSSLNRMNDLGLKYGDYINVTYVNDVMPYVTRCECDHNRVNQNPVILAPTICPICGTELVTSKSEKSLICPNQECPGRYIKRMTNMFDKLNLKGFGEVAIKATKCTHLFELENVTQSSLMENGMGPNESNDFFIMIQSLLYYTSPDYLIMGALGFTSIARKKWQNILHSVTIREMNDAYNRNPNQFLEFLNTIPGIGEVTAITIAKEYAFFKPDIDFILTKMSISDSKGSSLPTKKQIRFTGIRNKQLSELLISSGYDADDSSSVSKKTDILIVPYEGFSSSKVSKIGENTIVVPMDKFINNMEKYIGEKLL